MAIEEMTMMNVVGLLQHIDAVAKELILIEDVEPVNAMAEINESHFTLSVVEENTDELIDMTLIRPYTDEKNYDAFKTKMDTLNAIYNEPFTIDKQYVDQPYNFEACTQSLERLYSVLNGPYKDICQLQDNIEEIETFYKNFKHMESIDVNLQILNDLEFFTYTVGVLSKENRLKLKKNYENISAIVLHTGTSDIGEVYLVVSPKELEIETKRILRSLNFHEIDVPKDFIGTPKEIIESLQLKKNRLEAKLMEVQDRFHTLKADNKSSMDACYSRFRIQEKIESVKKRMVITQNFFYFSGWVPKRNQENIKRRLEKFSQSIISFKEQTMVEDHFVPPTKLKNNRLFRPFEFLVNMYGTPSYNELDPTAFLGITYMFLFGAMFGDVGQGLIIFFIGFILSKKSRLAAIGKIMSRLALSSILFGFLYGSLFGFEHILPALLIKPFDNINLILTAAIITGVFLLLISYGYSIINAIKQRDVEEGLFGKNGITGLVFYLTLLLLGGQNFLDKTWIPTGVGAALLIILGGIQIGKEPIANLVANKRPLYHETKSSYYIESSFDILETLLSMLSGTVSFIRVGAFALTHVGLFVAFETIAHLLGSLPGSVIVFIIGNVVIIGLEGLIVSIQALRLEYYELFSRYYKGEGRAFKPMELD